MSEAAHDSYWELGGICLRPLVAGDEPLVLRLFNDGGAEAERAYDRIGLPMSPADAAEWLESHLKDAARGDRRVFAILRSSDGLPLGFVDVWDADRKSGVFRTGIKMLPGESGKGNAAKAFARVLDYYFLELRYQKCGVYIYDFNDRSIRFHARFGFTEEGRLRRECYTQGRYHGAIWYGLTAEEYMSWRPENPACLALE